VFRSEKILTDNENFGRYIPGRKIKQQWRRKNLAYLEEGGFVASTLPNN
jgi:hypothetical protein